MVLLFSKIVRRGYIINARMTTTFECTFSQFRPDLVDQKYKSLCDSSTQNMLYILSTLSTGPSCLPFAFYCKVSKHLVLCHYFKQDEVEKLFVSFGTKRKFEYFERWVFF